MSVKSLKNKMSKKSKKLEDREITGEEAAYYQQLARDERLKELLAQRMQRNEELGLAASPSDAEIEYYNPEEKESSLGYVSSQNPKKIRIKEDIPTEDKTKMVIAHELQHVNQLAQKRWGGHDSAQDVKDPHEVTRRMRTIMAPTAGARDEIKNQSRFKQMLETLNPFKEARKVGFDTNKVLEYSKATGIPVDEILDAMTVNYAIKNPKEGGIDAEAFQAHEQVKKNLEKGLTGKQAYAPWEELKKKKKARK